MDKLNERHNLIITFENVSDGEVLNYSLAFVIGNIQCTSCKRTIDGIVKIQLGDIITESDVIKGKFKFFSDLNFGKNILHLCYEYDSHMANCFLSLEYKPKSIQKKLRLLYIIPKGDSGNYQSPPQFENTPSSAVKKIVLGAQLIQTFVALQIHKAGIGHKTFQLCCDSDFKPVCTVFESKWSREDFGNMSSEGIWECLARELLATNLITDSIKVLAFLSCTEYHLPCEDAVELNYSESLSYVKSYVACGAGHLAMVGCLSLYTWPSCFKDIMKCFTCTTTVDKHFFNESATRNTVGACYAASLGSALHEIGHIFNLVHSDGVMGRGFEDIDQFFTNSDTKIYSSVNRHSSTKEINVTMKVQAPMSSISTCFRHPQLPDRHTKLTSQSGAYFNRSSIVLLAGDPWFNEENCEQDLGPITFHGLEVKAPNGLRVVELHTDEDILFKYWDFLNNHVKLTRFCLSVYDVRNRNLKVLVQDQNGNIKKHKLNFNEGSNV